MSGSPPVLAYRHHINDRRWQGLIEWHGPWIWAGDFSASQLPRRESPLGALYDAKPTHGRAIATTRDRSDLRRNLPLPHLSTDQ